MSQNQSRHQTMGPLSVGNVVSAAIVLYRSHLKQYLGISLRAYLWYLLPILLPAFLVGGLIGSQVTDSAIGSAILLIMIVIWIPLLFYCIAKYCTNAALISRLGFGELIGQPESISNARNFIKPRTLSFLRVVFQIGLSLVGVYLILGIIISLIGVVLGFLLSIVFNNLFNSQFVNVVLLVILAIVGVIALLSGIIWFVSRWIIAEVPLAIEESINGKQSVERSWELTKNSVGRIPLIVVVAFLVTLPIVVITSYLPQIFLIQVEPGSSLYWMIYSVSLLTSFGGGILVLPFWQSIKAVLYYDLRSRREGLGMELRDTPLN